MVKDKIIPLYNEDAVCICMASDNHYAIYCGVVIYSLLKNGDPTKNYDILILEKNISDENKQRILEFTKMRKNISIRFINMSAYAQNVSTEVGSYYSIETNFRLYLFSELFLEYKRMIYLDCDVIVIGDISNLFSMELDEKLAGVVKDYTMEKTQLLCYPLFIGDTPYSVEAYCEEVLQLDTRFEYFNAGVMLVDLEACREAKIQIENVLEILHSRDFIYNDQDVLNILFQHRTKLIDVKWNYINYYHSYNKDNDMKPFYQEIYREHPCIIHYISGIKPWKHMPHDLGEDFWKQVRNMEKEYADWNGVIIYPANKNHAFKC